MKFSTAWAMPNKHTFQQPPIVGFLSMYISIRSDPVVVDPFCGTSPYGTHSNDLAHGGVDAQEYCEQLLASGVLADVVIFDPPYSPRQISECYMGIGRAVTPKDTQNAALYARVRKPLAALLRVRGVALSFGWQSSGFGKDFETIEILLVQHGGAHNDTICVAQVKP